MLIGLPAGTSGTGKPAGRFQVQASPGGGIGVGAGVALGTGVAGTGSARPVATRNTSWVPVACPGKGSPRRSKGPAQSGSVGEPWQPPEVPGVFVARSLRDNSVPTSSKIASRVGSKPSSAIAGRLGLSQPLTLPRPSPWQRVLPTWTL